MGQHGARQEFPRGFLKPVELAQICQHAPYGQVVGQMGAEAQGRVRLGVGGIGQDQFVLILHDGEINLDARLRRKISIRHGLHLIDIGHRPVHPDINGHIVFLRRPGVPGEEIIYKVQELFPGFAQRAHLEIGNPAPLLADVYAVQRHGAFLNTVQHRAQHLSHRTGAFRERGEIGGQLVRVIPQLPQTAHHDLQIGDIRIALISLVQSDQPVPHLLQFIRQPV